MASVRFELDNRLTFLMIGVWLAISWAGCQTSVGEQKVDGRESSDFDGGAEQDAKVQVDVREDADGGPEGADAGNRDGDVRDGGEDYVVMRAVRDSRGLTFLCEEDLDERPGQRHAHLCVQDEPEETRRDVQYRCEFDSDAPAENRKVAYNYCTKLPNPESTWEPPCYRGNSVGSGSADAWGRNCWSPPEHYCQGLCVAAASNDLTWSCKPDGSACCISKCKDCHRCGWVMMESATRCRMSGERTRADEKKCRAVFNRLSRMQKKCVKGNCSQAEIEQVDSHPKCRETVPDKSLRFCRRER